MIVNNQNFLKIQLHMSSKRATDSKAKKAADQLLKKNIHLFSESRK